MRYQNTLTFRHHRQTQLTSWALYLKGLTAMIDVKSYTSCNSNI